MKSPKSLLRLKRPKPLFVRRVVGASMTPTLQPGHHVVVSSLVVPQVGHIVVIEHDNKEKIKRISSLDGQAIEVTGDNQLSSTDSKDFGPLHIDAVVGVVVWPRLSKTSQHPDQV